VTPSSAKKEPAAQDLSPEEKQAATNAKRAATRAANKAVKDATGDSAVDGKPEPKKRGPKPGAKAAAEAAGKAARGASDSDEDDIEDPDDIILEGADAVDDGEIDVAKAASAATGKGFVYSDADDDDAPVQ
jgi:RNA polymerase primary sigma factor